MTNLKKQGVIPKAEFSIYVSDQDELASPTSFLSFGSHDINKYACSDFDYVNVTRNEEQWEFAHQGYLIGKQAIKETRTAVISTSFGTLLISSTAYLRLKIAVESLVHCQDVGSGLLAFDCANDEENQLPDLTFIVGKLRLSVSPKQYTVRFSGTICQILVQPEDSNRDILGLPFLRAYYTLFDAETPRLGFARSVNNPPPSDAFWLIFGGIVLGVVLVCVAVAVYCYCRKTPSPQTEPDWIEPLVRNNE